MTNDRISPRSLVLLVLPAACMMFSACGDAPTAKDRTAVMRWLKCEECVENELEAVRSGGNRVVGLLAEALRGPAADSAANVEHQLSQAYVRLRARGPAPVLDSARYVNHYLRNYRSLYQSRAITGLAAIGSARAMDSLEAAKARAESGVVAYQYRSDVKDELDRAVEGRWASISAGLLSTCGIRTNGKSYCWGNNDSGQVGDGSNTGRPRPTAVALPSGAADSFRFISIAAAGSGWHTCGISADKVAFCWGQNARGQLGDGSSTDQSIPTAVAGNITFVGITAGGQHSCAWTPDYRAFCWGASESGQVGDGSTTGRLVPTAVAANLGPVRISAGATHTCADSLDNVLFCWGSNTDGQLGDGTTASRPSPTTAGTAVPVKALSVGATHTCVLAESTSTIPEGAAYCAGNNDHGQLGDGSTTTRSEFTKVVGPLFLAISAGENHTCGISEHGRMMFCWGDNQSGQLGNGTTVEQTTPDSVSGGRSYLWVSAGGGHTCGITVQGEAYCWGRNSDGQLGDTTTVDRPTPAKVVKPAD